MRKMKPIINIIVILLFFIVLHDPILIVLGNVFTLFREDNKNDLIENAYQDKIEILERSIAEYEKSLENLKVYEGSSYILGKIALRNVYDFYDILAISVESAVKKGDAVINEDGLVGIVTEANKKTAKVSLLTGNTNISVKIGESYGILNEYDKKENLLVVHNINNYANIEDGSIVETSGLQEIDGQIKIGTVESSEVIGVERVVYVKPAVDFSHLNYLMVIDK